MLPEQNSESEATTALIKKPKLITSIGCVFIILASILLCGEIVFLRDYEARLLVISSMVLTIIMIFAGVQFITLRPWSRIALKIFSWLIMIFILIVIIYDELSVERPIDLEIIVEMTLSCLVTICFLGLIIILLGSKEVKELFVRANKERQEFNQKKG
ncbi:MAG: hypothetical protein QME51_02930 [Planctomycetota bacterium]|nr:hypothetical protein [Planctomycetota bacterium]MDI6787308.1 hypothetical protein [Planctomycetota bacterium]